MSAFSEAQKQEIRLIIRAELERYFNAALMYTESCKTRTVEHGEGTSKTFSQSPTPPPSTTPTSSAIKWEKMPPTEKGVWEKTVDVNNPTLEHLIHKIEAENKAVDYEGYRYWLTKKDGKIEAVARRVKA